MGALHGHGLCCVCLPERCLYFQSCQLSIFHLHRLSWWGKKTELKALPQRVWLLEDPPQPLHYRLQG